MNHCKEFLKRAFRALALRQSDSKGALENLYDSQFTLSTLLIISR